MFVVPCFLLLALAVGIGVWLGKKHGAKRGLGMAALTIGIGVVVLVVLFASYVVLYYASGGH